MPGQGATVEESRTVTVRVPLTIKRRGGRKLVLAPETELTTSPVERQFDNATVKAIARAFRWQEMLEDGTCSTIAEIAAVEQINETYVGRVLRLVLLAPNIIETIVGGRQPAAFPLAVLMTSVPALWSAQQVVYNMEVK